MKTPVIDYHLIPKDSAFWNIGQFSKADIRYFEKEVKAGRLTKARSRWMGISNLKTVYFYAADQPRKETNNENIENAVNTTEFKQDHQMARLRL